MLRMIERKALSLAAARRCVDTILDAAIKDGDRPVAVAVVDERGDLVAFGRMDGTATAPQTYARKKAYTAAMSRSVTAEFAERLRSQGRAVADYGDPGLIAMQGGVPVLSGGVFLGGIGVSGRTAQQDEDLCTLGLKAMALP